VTVLATLLHASSNNGAFLTEIDFPSEEQKMVSRLALIVCVIFLKPSHNRWISKRRGIT